jgi:hypothetical protein
MDAVEAARREGTANEAMIVVTRAELEVLRGCVLEARHAFGDEKEFEIRTGASTTEADEVFEALRYLTSSRFWGTEPAGPMLSGWRPPVPLEEP